MSSSFQNVRQYRRIPFGGLKMLSGILILCLVDVLLFSFMPHLYWDTFGFYVLVGATSLIVVSIYLFTVRPWSWLKHYWEQNVRGFEVRFDSCENKKVTWSIAVRGRRGDLDQNRSHPEGIDQGVLRCGDSECGENYRDNPHVSIILPLGGWFHRPEIRINRRTSQMWTVRDIEWPDQWDVGLPTVGLGEYLNFKAVIHYDLFDALDTVVQTRENRYCETHRAVLDSCRDQISKLTEALDAWKKLADDREQVASRLIDEKGDLQGEIKDHLKSIAAMTEDRDWYKQHYLKSIGIMGLLARQFEKSTRLLSSSKDGLRIYVSLLEVIVSESNLLHKHDQTFDPELEWTHVEEARFVGAKKKLEQLEARFVARKKAKKEKMATA